jgi:hypothetical protein
LVVLRCPLLGALVGEPRINRWVPMLQASRVLRVLCGLPAEGDCPGVGTFYDFLHRLHDGLHGIHRRQNGVAVFHQSVRQNLDDRALVVHNQYRFFHRTTTLQENCFLVNFRFP